MMRKKTARGINPADALRALLRFFIFALGCTLLVGVFSYGEDEIPAEAKIVAIKGGWIYTAADQGLIEKGIILIQGGRILDVGARISIPQHAEVFNLQNKFIMPGIVSPDSNLGVYIRPLPSGSSFGVRTPQTAGKNLAYYPVVYSIDPGHYDYSIALKFGFTTLALSPPPSGISGLGAIIKPLGKTLKDIMISDRAFLKISVASNTPFFNMLKNALEEAQKKEEELKKREEEKKDKADAQKREKKKIKETVSEEEKEEISVSETTRVFMDVIEGKLPLLAECQDPDGVSHLLAIVSGYPKIKLGVRGGPDTYKAGSLLKEKNIPLILEPDIDMKTSFFAPYPERTNYVLKCLGLGLKLAFQAPRNIEDHIQLFHYLGRLALLGVDKDILFRGVTLVPAEILGLEKMVGSLEKGKAADLLVFASNPLENYPVLEQVILGGTIVR